MFRAIAQQYTCPGALRQTAGGPFRSSGDAAAVAAGTRQLHQPRALRRPVGAHPCALVRPPSRPFPFARLAVAALGAAHPRVPEGLGALLAMDASFVTKSGDETWGTGWFWSGMARAARWGLEVTLLAAVDVEEGGAYPLCARQSPGAVRSRRQACGDRHRSGNGRHCGPGPAGEEAVEAGAKEILGARWVAVDGGYSNRPFVEGVRKLGPAYGGSAAQGRGPALPLTPAPTNGGPVARSSSTAASTAATRRAWPAPP